MGTNQDFGDTPLDLDAPTFTLSEAARLAGVPRKSVHVWRERGHIAVGRQERPGGALELSLLDVLRLSTMAELCVQRQTVSLADGAIIAQVVADAAVASTSDAARADGHRPNVTIICAWDAAGELLAQVCSVKHLAAYPPRPEGDEHQPLRHPFITIPATSMLVDLLARATAMRGAQAQAEVAVVE